MSKESFKTHESQGISPLPIIPLYHTSSRLIIPLSNYNTFPLETSPPDSFNDFLSVTNKLPTTNHSRCKATAKT